MRTNVRVIAPIAMAVLVLGVVAMTSGAVAAQSVPVGGGPTYPLTQPPPPAPPVAPPQSPIEAPAAPTPADLPTGGQAGAGTVPAALPSAGTGTGAPADASGLLVLAAAGVIAAGAGVSMRRTGRRS